MVLIPSPSVGTNLSGTSLIGSTLNSAYAPMRLCAYARMRVWGLYSHSHDYRARTCSIQS